MTRQNRGGSGALGVRAPVARRASGTTRTAATATSATTGIVHSSTGRHPTEAAIPGTSSEVTAAIPGTPAVLVASPTAWRSGASAATTATFVATVTRA